MKLDLCKLFGVEEGEEFYINENEIFLYKIHNQKLKYMYNDEEKLWRNASISINTFTENFTITKLPKKKQFSQDTLNFFKCIDKKWEWIAKDKNGYIYVFDIKPRKGGNQWWCSYGTHTNMVAFNQSLFDQILWEDEEPIRIDDYVER